MPQPALPREPARPPSRGGSTATRRRRWRPLVVAALLIAALLAAPIAFVLFSLFQESGGAGESLMRTVLPRYIFTTIYIGVLTALGTAIIGVGTAWLVTMCRFPGARLFEWLLALPLAMPAYVIAYAYTEFLDHPGPVQTLLREMTGWGPRDYWFPEIRSDEGAAAMFVLVLYPYVYLLARGAFLQQSVEAFEVGRSLGRTAWQSFRQVALPLARPAIVTGVALALMETFADYGTVADFNVQTFTTGIYRAWFSMGDRIAAGQLASFLLMIVFTLLLLERWQRGQSRFTTARRNTTELPDFRLTGWRRYAAFGFCALPVVLGFEGAGRVEEAGPGVTGFAAGDRVAYALPPHGALVRCATIQQRISSRCRPPSTTSTTASSPPRCSRA